MRTTDQADRAPDRRGRPWRDTDRTRSGGRSKTTVQVAVELSPATAAAASIGSTPSCGVMRNRAMMSVSLGS